MTGENHGTSGVGTLQPIRDPKTGRLYGMLRLPSAADAALQERFEAACLAARGLAHANLLKVERVARDSKGSFCLTEWPAGGTIAQSLPQGEHREPEVVRIVSAVGRALDHAHKHQLIHGGVRAEHIYRAADGEPKLTGFGLELESEPAVDLVALGRVLYQLVTGDAPGTMTLSRLEPWLQEILRRSLSGDPDARFRSIEEFVREVEEGFQRTGSLGSGVSHSAPPAAEEVEGTPAEFPFIPLAERFRLTGESASGGMGTVMKAVEIATGRNVAIKRLHLALAKNEQVVARFRREAFTIANLVDPHILPLLQPARDDDGDYLVLEWAEGGSLKDRLDRSGPLPVRELLSIAHKVGKALHYAHSCGVIHRDIKPHNILLTATGEPRLSDFGIARALQATFASTSTRAGTPHYMPPEQWSLKDSVDARSDVYAFGKTLYHLATAEVPATIDPARIPGPLRAPLLKAMATRKEDRHETIAAFLFAIERSLKQAKSAATPPPRSTSAVSLLLHDQRLVVGAGLLLFLVAIAVGWAVLGARDHAPEELAAATTAPKLIPLPVEPEVPPRVVDLTLAPRPVEKEEEHDPKPPGPPPPAPDPTPEPALHPAEDVLGDPPPTPDDPKPDPLVEEQTEQPPPPPPSPPPPPDEDLQRVIALDNEVAAGAKRSRDREIIRELNAISKDGGTAVARAAARLVAGKAGEHLAAQETPEYRFEVLKGVAEDYVAKIVEGDEYVGATDLLYQGRSIRLQAAEMGVRVNPKIVASYMAEQDAKGHQSTRKNPIYYERLLDVCRQILANTSGD